MRHLYRSSLVLLLIGTTLSPALAQGTAAVPQAAMAVPSVAGSNPVIPTSATASPAVSNPVVQQPAQSSAAPAIISPPISDNDMLAKVDAVIAAHASLDSAIAPPQNLHSLLFTTYQQALLEETRQNANNHISTDPGSKPTGPREVSLGGISYRNADDWTVWLNSERVKPDALPPRVLAFKVTKNYVDLKWFDDASNLIYPIRLHPHERFNLDDRIFLPGAGLDSKPVTTKSGT